MGVEIETAYGHWLTVTANGLTTCGPIRGNRHRLGASQMPRRIGQANRANLPTQGLRFADSRSGTLRPDHMTE